MVYGDLTNLEMPKPKSEQKSASSQDVEIGKLLPPKQHLLLFYAEDWECFIEEWGQFQKSKYTLVTRLGGANDLGVDVACFCSEKGFTGDWDNFQCKYYKGEPLAPSTAIPEIGKLLWHVHNKRLTKPRNYYFFAPKDCGPSLKKLLLDSEKLKDKLISEWDSWCSESITSLEKIALDGAFKTFVSNFDFSIFKYKPVADVIEEHRNTPYFSIRFGGGLKQRPVAEKPPESIQSLEHKYIEQLKKAYADSLGLDISKFDLDNHLEFSAHFKRQREAFYHAESLRSFARDSVPQGTFDDLKTDMLDGIIDTAEEPHPNGYIKAKKTLAESKLVPLDANGLFQAIRVKDRYGICHQLVNDLELRWIDDKK
ncbi:MULTISPECIES: ABC-three component system protein [Vibrio]|uniref:ABC-three component systems C-terminal domain-containing protein n=1 Tax=Vibrio crassostreae TaxID=246167 RepID=A0ABP1WUE2_9VIBR|nr:MULTISPECIES: ABC-three component system protein [Vibrio]PTP15605.1 hypothetical protein CWO27_07770 [Vibrio sp. 10N.286.51.C3]TCL30160.1 hypothetical protein EDB52_101444 [Vibrio crassostreae]TKE63332.1 hypothetical protein FCV45_15105 [Vibrio sp. F12]CAK1865599.1 ABC-three component systems C-terminal domain-containing protein [Vibrio crassostreae]CAK1873982.1 ABC-three component systems C-terminal domain-containing protein [Vibrio crassostreae]